jgi:hypothetical protein
MVRITKIKVPFRINHFDIAFLQPSIVFPAVNRVRVCKEGSSLGDTYECH